MARGRTLEVMVPALVASTAVSLHSGTTAERVFNDLPVLLQ